MVLVGFVGLFVLGGRKRSIVFRPRGAGRRRRGPGLRCGRSRIPGPVAGGRGDRSPPRRGLGCGSLTAPTRGLHGRRVPAPVPSVGGRGEGVYALEVEQHAEVGNDGAGGQPNAIAAGPVRSPGRVPSAVGEGAWHKTAPRCLQAMELGGNLGIQ